jgi:hypothetical protein
MAKITRDPILDRSVPLDQGETLNAACRADPAAIELAKAGEK